MPYRLLIARGDKALAAQQMEAAYDQMAADGCYPLVKIRLTQALAAPNVDTALPFLAEALKLGEPEGYVRTFADEGKLIKPLLEKAISQGIKPEYARKLLAVIEAEEEQLPSSREKMPSHAPALNILSRREIEVIRLIASGFSDHQIADKLVISLSTAKTHVHHIFAKLHAKDRLQAVNRARDLQLF
jgi:LuxR family maltose regulon positive regulatory protein